MSTAIISFELVCFITNYSSNLYTVPACIQVFAAPNFPIQDEVILYAAAADIASFGLYRSRCEAWVVWEIQNSHWKPRKHYHRGGPRERVDPEARCIGIPWHPICETPTIASYGPALKTDFRCPSVADGDALAAGMSNLTSIIGNFLANLSHTSSVTLAAA